MIPKQCGTHRNGACRQVIPQGKAGIWNMRILVVSDTHGNEAELRRAVLSQTQAELVIHLGDGEEECGRVKRAFPEKMFLQVRGNCDWGSSLPVTGTHTVEGVTLFYTHGHVYSVKHGDYQAVVAAREQKADILLYGHTHEALTDYRDGLYLLNPGSLSGWRASYGTIDITPQGIVTNVVQLR